MSEPHPPPGRSFWIGCALGVPIMAAGVRGAIAGADEVHPAELGRWIVGSAVVHDAFVLPVVCVVAVALRRWVPAWAWPSVRWALATTAILAVVSRPFAAGWGRSASNPTALPRAYGSGALVAIAVVWAAAAAWALWNRRHEPRSG